MKLFTRLFFWIFCITKIDGIRISLIANAVLIPITNETILMNDSSIDKCLCIMLNSTKIFSMSYFSNNRSCGLFLNNNNLNSFYFQINLNSTVYFRQSFEFTSEVSDATTIMSQTEMTTDSNCRSNSVLSSISNIHDHWVLVGNMSVPRFSHTSTFIMEDDGTGSVLIAGGCVDINGTPTLLTEKYLVAFGCFILTKEMDIPRRSHTADRLSSLNSTILLGGGNDGTLSLSIATLYDSLTTINMSTSRLMHTSTILSGKLVFIGGVDSTGSSTNTGDVFDGSTFLPVKDNMRRARINHTATALPEKNLIFIPGGTNNPNIEIYDGTSNRFISVSTSLRMSSTRTGHTATYLPSPFNMILIAGGGQQSFDLFNATTLSLEIRGGQMMVDRTEHTATLLVNGLVLLVGGRSVITYQALLSCETFNPITELFSLGSNLNVARYGHTATLIEPDNNTVLVCGGQDSNDLPLNSCELYIL